MPKIIHAADFHLDSAFAGLEPDKARTRRGELRELPDRLAELVLAERVELVLLSGDLFDSERVYPETVEALRRALERMACPVFIAPGNHDPCTARSPYRTEKWPDNVHIFQDTALAEKVLPSLDCVVHGAAFSSTERADQVLEGFSVPQDGRTHILCLHGDLLSNSSRYGPITREQLGRCGADYAALGHVHQTSGLRREGACFWAYPGCPEGRGFDELGDKGVLVGTVGPGRAEMKFVPLCRRRYHIVEADVTGRDPRTALESALPPTAGDDLCRIIFTGEAGTIDLGLLAASFQDRVYELELRDKTRPAQSLWDRAGEDTLRGLFLQEMRYRYDTAPSEAERDRVALAVRFGLAAIEGRDL